MGSEVKSFDDFASPFLALQNGQVEAVVSDFTSLRAQMKVIPNLRTMGAPMLPGAETGVYKLRLREAPPLNFPQEASPFFRFVYPVLDQAGGRDVVVLVLKLMGLS